MTTTNERAAAGGAVVVLPGHPDTKATVRVEAVPFAARVARTAGMGALWGSITLATFLITMFDPFMTSLPTLVGAMAVYRSWRGRFRLLGFRAACPRCGSELRMKRDARVSLPHPLVCYACHHEPRLVFAPA